MIVLPNNSPPIKNTLPGQIETGNIHPEAVVAFAESLFGTPYLYASTDPKSGFDCSGFITYVFNHFGIKVPRSSIDFTNVGKEVAVKDAKRGDIILFTGTDSTERYVGHMGIIVSNVNGELQFIHSSSGKAHGVTVSPLKGYYIGRFVKVIRIFKQLDPL
jgi:cell wall-associated NlpC family hydrolase